MRFHGMAVDFDIGNFNTTNISNGIMEVWWYGGIRGIRGIRGIVVYRDATNFHFVCSELLYYTFSRGGGTTAFGGGTATIPLSRPRAGLNFGGVPQ